jgi:hypothetical protein
MAKYTEEEVEEMFCDSLDEAGDIVIGSLRYSPSHVLKSVDPLAYEIGIDEYADFLGANEEEEEEEEEVPTGWSL